MQDFINKLISQVKNIFSKTTKVQKAIVIGILVVALGAIIATIILSSRRTGTLLFQKALSQEDARNVISVLEASNIKYQYRNGFITLNNMSDKAKAELELVKEGKMPTYKYKKNFSFQIKIAKNIKNIHFFLPFFLFSGP